MVDPGRVRRLLEDLADYRGKLATLSELRALAGLRNRLVHVYEEVEDRIVHESLSEGLNDLSSFSRAIARLAEV